MKKILKHYFISPCYSPEVPVLRTEWLVWSTIHSGNNQKKIILVLNSELNYPTQICCSPIWIWTHKRHTRCRYCFYKSITLLLTEWPANVPEVPKTELQVFDGLKKMHVYLSSASFWNSSSVSIHLALISFPWNYRACSKKTVHSFSTTDYVKFPLQNKHIKYH